MPSIAFFGLGTMGLPIAANLLKAGHRLHVLPHNGHMEAPLKAAACGAVIHDTLEETVADADFIISVIPDDKAVRELYVEGPMKDLVKRGVTIIDMTSCSPDAIREVAALYGEAGVHVLDAPITGALPRAIDGTLTIMCAGEDEDIDRAEPVFSAISEKVFRLGPVGNGKLVKAMTNLLGAVNLAAAGEFHRFAQAMGLAPEVMAEVVAASAGGSTQFSRNYMRMVKGDFHPAFTLGLLRKDMKIALDCAEKIPGLAMPLSNRAYGLYENAKAHDRDDCSSIALCDGGTGND